MKKLLSLIICSIFTVSGIASQDVVAVAKNGNVYDDANAKYITVNQNNEDLAVIPGMVFTTTQHTPGWYKVEYSPGLHAFIPDQITGPSLKPVSAGIYEIQNNPGHQISVEGSGDNITATAEGKSYKGKVIDNILIFVDGNNIVYSIVDLGNGPIAITYDNSVTKFF